MPAPMNDEADTALRWQMRFTSVRRSVPRVRMQVARVLGRWGCHPEELVDAVLVVDELTSNAVRHGHVRGRLFEVELRSGPEGIVVEVSDAHFGRPRPREAGETEESGRGLNLVESLSTRWGVRERPGGVGKTVWAHLPRTTTYREWKPPPG